MKIVESHYLPTLKKTAVFAKKRGVDVSVGILREILNKVHVRNNTFVIPGTFPATMTYLRFNKKTLRGYLVEVCQSD